MVKPLAVYLHIPFCRQKCGYCDFLSFAGREDLVKPYLAALVQEIQLLAGERPPVATVYIGGGTPTLLPGEELAALVEEVRSEERRVGKECRCRGGREHCRIREMDKT